jgi:cytochrome c553
MAPGIRTWELRGLPEWTDWYLATELRKFRSGVRGTNPKDREGRLMRPMARALPDEDAIRNVVAYAETLKP